MKAKIIALGIFVLTAATVVLYPKLTMDANAKTVAPPRLSLEEAPKIQIAILLDTSSSMDGLINQTREQLWQIVNEFARAKQSGKTPKLEVAVYEYGNSGLSAKNGYIRQVSAFTPELDQVSEALFSLRTNGGDEYCGYVIQTAVNDLAWSKSDKDIKSIFIAGNEPFTQGPVAFKSAIEKARGKGIKVNTIHAGSVEEGASTGWKEGALLAGGEYMAIDHNFKVVHIDAPQDKRLAELNAQLNNTYVPYGAQGQLKADRQAREDSKNLAVSPALAAKRTESKASSMYDNSNWDLVDAVKDGKVEMDKLDKEQLPASISAMPLESQKEYVKKKAEERAKIQEEIKTLSKQRNEYITREKAAAAKPAVNTVEEAMIKSIRKQGEEKNFKFN